MNYIRCVLSYIKSKQGAAAIDLAVLVALFAFALFHGLGSVPLMDPDEGRYAEVPREMLVSGDFLTPHFNYVHFFSKPPLFYWMNAFSFLFFGINEFAARFPSALCGLATILVVYFLGYRLFDRRTAFSAALVMGATGGHFVCARLSLLDLPLTLFLTAALGLMLLGFMDAGPRKRAYFCTAYLFMALAVLAKGLIGIILPGLIVLLFCLFSRRWHLIREMRLGCGILIVAAVSSPWFVYISVKYPGYAKYFFLREHLERFTSDVHNRHEFFGFYIPMFIGLMFPWSLLLPPVIARFRDLRRTPNFMPWIFLATWAISIFVFFSLSESNLATYILPAFPAFALLTGATISDGFDSWPRLIRWPALIIGIIFCVAGATSMALPLLIRPGFISTILCVLVGTLIIILGLYSLKSVRKMDLAGLFCALCLAVFAVELAGPVVIPPFFAYRTIRKLALTAKENIRPDTLLASFLYDPSLAFYTGRKFLLVDAGKTNELQPVGPSGDASIFLSTEQFLAKWDSAVHIIALLKDRDLEWIQPRVKTKPHILGNSKDHFLITNEPPPYPRPLRSAQRIHNTPVYTVINPALANAAPGVIIP